MKAHMALKLLYCGILTGVQESPPLQTGLPWVFHCRLPWRDVGCQAGAKGLHISSSRKCSRESAVTVAGDGYGDNDGNRELPTPKSSFPKPRRRDMQSWLKVDQEPQNPMDLELLVHKEL